MVFAALLLAGAAATQPLSIRLERGARLAEMPYYDVQDTILDRERPDQNFAGSRVLETSENAALLIRFGGLELLGNVRVISARLVLSTTGTAAAQAFRRAFAVNRAWTEGPYAAPFAAAPEPNAPKPRPQGATWRQRNSAGQGWDRAGASGSDARDIGDLTWRQEGTEVFLEGLGPAVQRMVDRPMENHGFVLNFSRPGQFASSEATTGRPRLEIDFEPRPVTGFDLAVTELAWANGQATGRVENAGQVESPARSLVLTQDRRPLATVPVPALAPGQGHRFQVAFSAPEGPWEATLAEPDEYPSNDGVRFYPGAATASIPVEDSSGARADLQRFARQWNEGVLAASRYSFVPEGPAARLNVVPAVGDAPFTADRRPEFGQAMRLPRGNESTAYRGVMAYGDSRPELFVPGALPLPYQGFENPVFRINPLVPSGLLAMTDVALLQRSGGPGPLPLPPTTLVRVQDLGGRALPNTRVISSAAGPLAPPLTTNSGGAVLLRTENLTFDPAKPEEAIELTLERFGVQERFRLMHWMLADAAARGNRQAAIFELRFNLPEAAVDREVDLARDKPVSDSEGRPASDLVTLVSNGQTAVAFPPSAGGWVEIDLGRDRTLGEVVVDFDGLTGGMDVVGYGTGQRPADATVFARDPSEAARNGAKTYRGAAIRIRFLRLLRRTEGTGGLKRISVYPAIVGG